MGTRLTKHRRSLFYNFFFFADLKEADSFFQMDEKWLFRNVPCQKYDCIAFSQKCPTPLYKCLHSFLLDLFCFVYSAESDPLLPDEKFSTLLTVFFSIGMDVPPDVTKTIRFEAETFSQKERALPVLASTELCSASVRPSPRENQSNNFPFINFKNIIDCVLCEFWKVSKSPMKQRKQLPLGHLPQKPKKT